MAVNDPLEQEARDISKTIFPFLKIVGAKVRWSCFERSNALTHLYAMNQFFGLSFLFVTISPSMRTHHWLYECVTASRIRIWNYRT